MAKRLDAIREEFRKYMRMGVLDKHGGVKWLARQLDRPEKTIRNWRDQELRQESQPAGPTFDEDTRARRDELIANATWDNMIYAIGSTPGEDPFKNAEGQIALTEDRIALLKLQVTTSADPSFRHQCRVEIKELQAQIEALKKRN